MPKTLAKSQVNTQGNPPLSEVGSKGAIIFWFRHPLSLDWAYYAERGMIMRVAIYARVSTDGQSVNAQLAELREVADRRGWEIVREYTDKGISGAKGRERRILPPATKSTRPVHVRRLAIQNNRACSLERETKVFGTAEISPC